MKYETDHAFRTKANVNSKDMYASSPFVKLQNCNNTAKNDKPPKN